MKAKRKGYKCLYCEWGITTNAQYDGRRCPECDSPIVPTIVRRVLHQEHTFAEMDVEFKCGHTKRRQEMVHKGFRLVDKLTWSKDNARCIDCEMSERSKDHASQA